MASNFESMTSKKYFFSKNNEKKGPHLLDEMLEMIISGEIDKTTLVWSKGLDRWMEAQLLKELIEVFDELSPPDIPTQVEIPKEVLYKKPSTLGKYFSYGDEYISGGAFFVRSLLMLLLPGLNLYLLPVNIYKRLRSLGQKPKDAALVLVVLLGLAIMYVGANVPFDRDEREAGILTLITAAMYWYWVFRNSQAPLRGGAKPFLQFLHVDSQKKYGDLKELLSQEMDFREKHKIPKGVILIPHPILQTEKAFISGQTKSLQDAYGNESFFFAMQLQDRESRDSIEVFNFPSFPLVPSSSFGIVKNRRVVKNGHVKFVIVDKVFEERFTTLKKYVGVDAVD